MKRPSSSDSLGAFMSICPSTEEHSPNNNHVYGREFQSMLEGFDEEGCVEECGGQIGEKKRRLSVHQVKALEKNFEVENKLEPERKVKLAQELGLQPRQVAVWFQNRRARWKTKQLERDYGVLKSSYDALKQNCDSLRHENDDLLKQIRELKSKLREEDEDDDNDDETDNSAKEDQIASESIAKFVEQSAKSVASLSGSDDAHADLNYETFNHGGAEATLIFPDLKDGSSDSDSSAILNEDNNSSSPKSASAVSSTGGSLLHTHHLAASPNPSSMLKFGGGGSSANCYPLSDPKAAVYHPQFVKVEEHNFFGDEACNFFSDEQAPTLQWYSDQWP